MVLVVFDLVVFDVDSVFVDIDVVVNCMLVCQKRLILILSYLIQKAIPYLPGEAYKVFRETF